MQLSPTILSDARGIGAWIVFFCSYFVFALGKFPGLKIDRPGAAIIGAVLMVAFRIMTAQEALRAIDFSTIVLLFSMTLIVALRAAPPGPLRPAANESASRLHRPRFKPVMVLGLVLAGFLAGVPPALMAALGAAALLITRTTEPRLVYDEVDWGLLVFFVGLFI